MDSGEQMVTTWAVNANMSKTDPLQAGISKKELDSYRVPWKLAVTHI